MRSAYAHEGAARAAVHALKYEAIDQVAAVVAPALANLVPTWARALVPIPRALSRRIQYGVDTAVLLAGQVGRLTGTPVVASLRAPVLHTSQIRRRRSHVRRFRAVGPLPKGAVLVDDVVTTGATLTAARHALGGLVDMAITVTRATGSI